MSDALDSSPLSPQQIAALRSRQIAFLAERLTDPAKIGEFATYRTLLLIAVSSVLVFELARRALRSAESPRLRPRSGASARASSLRSQINLLILAVAVPLVALLG